MNVAGMAARLYVAETDGCFQVGACPSHRELAQSRMIRSAGLQYRFVVAGGRVVGGLQRGQQTGRLGRVVAGGRVVGGGYGYGREEVPRGLMLRLPLMVED